MIIFLAWLRYKLFRTEFAAIEFGGDFYLRKVRYTNHNKTPYLVIYGKVIQIALEDNLDSYNRCIWIFQKL